MTIDNILEENTRLKVENEHLNDIIHDKINVNEDFIEHNADNLRIVESKVSTNRRIDENKAYIEQNTDDISALHLAPIGTISAWVTKPTKETKEEEMVSLPDSWVRCSPENIV